MQILYDMATLNTFLDMRRQLRDGSYPIKFNINHYGQIVISTGISTLKGALLGNMIQKKDPDYKPKNALLSIKINKIQTLLIKLENDDQLSKITNSELKRIINDIVSPSYKRERTFIERLEEFASTKSNGTQTIYNTTKNKILKFDKSCTFDTIDRKWLQRFEKKHA